MRTKIFGSLLPLFLSFCWVARQSLKGSKFPSNPLVESNWPSQWSLDDHSRKVSLVLQGFSRHSLLALWESLSFWEPFWISMELVWFWSSFWVLVRIKTYGLYGRLFLAPHWSFHFLDLFLYFLWDPKNLGLLRPSFSSSMLVWFHSQPIYYCRLDLVVGWILFLAFFVPQKNSSPSPFPVGCWVASPTRSWVASLVRSWVTSSLRSWVASPVWVNTTFEFSVSTLNQPLCGGLCYLPRKSVEMPDSCGVVVEPRIHGQMEGSCQRGLWQLLSTCQWLQLKFLSGSSASLWGS